MILAGIDEAGYGPLLGPLVTACAALRLPGRSGDDVPDAWKLLAQAVSRTRDRNGRKLHIADSKAVYTPAAGVAGLERGVLAFAAAAGLPTDRLDPLIAALDPFATDHLRRHPWYAAESPFPAAITPDWIGPAANGLRVAMNHASVSFPTGCLHARIIPEGRYNDLARQTRNKASVLFMHVAQLINSLLVAHAHEPGGILLVCDRQGGREHYGDGLRMMFPDYRLGIVQESDGIATYQLDRPGCEPAVISFREKGETLCLPTALASMICKYLREMLMERFNRFFAAHEPGLTPTAGYYTDGMRFLAESQSVRKRLGIVDAELIRER